MLDKKDLGNALRIIRELQELKQDDLAQKSNVDQSTISRIEKGKRMPGTDIFMSLAKALQTSPDEILDWNNALKGQIKETGPVYFTNTDIARLVELATRLKKEDLIKLLRIAEVLLSQDTDK